MDALHALRRLTLPVRWQVALDRLRAQVVFRGCARGRGTGASGPVRVEGRAHLQLGAGVQFTGGPVPTALVSEGGELVIGDGCHFNYGVSVRSAASVRIGRRCMFGSFVHIADERDGRTAPVRLGDDVWVAHGATVAPGVTVGDGAVISAGSVVTRDVPPRTLALGNPARVMSLELAQQP